MPESATSERRNGSAVGGIATGAGAGRQTLVGEELTIRRAAPNEAVEVGLLTERIYRAGGFTNEAYSAVLLDGASRVADAIVVVAVLDGRLVASATAAPAGTPYAAMARDGELEVRMLGVADEARRRGIADRLMDAVEDLARERGLGGVILSTEPGMRAAHRLYERRGYVRRPDRDRRAGGFTLLAYRKDLQG